MMALAEPKPAPPGVGATVASSGPTGTYKRRKFVTKSKPGVGRLKHVKLSTVQQALEEDSTAVEALKRDVADFQHLELETSRRYLVSLQKAYDKLRAEADSREAQQRQCQEELYTLDRLCTEARQKVVSPDAPQAALQADIDREEKLVRDALVQKDVFTHMIKRLSDDILVIRQAGHGVKDALGGVEREIAGVALQLQTAKQDSKNEEDKLQRLGAQVKARRRMQEQRLAGIQRVIAERSSLVEKQEERMRMREAVMARSKFDLGAQEEQRLKRMHVIRKVYSSMLEKKITAEEESLSALETTFQKIKIVTGLSDVDEIVQKFKDRTFKTHQLQQLAEDVRERIDALRDDNARLKEELLSMKSTNEAAAGNREIYQEMDAFNKGLGKALRQCEEAKDRAIRSDVTLEQLKLAIARFRSKIECKPFPTPTDSQLPEYLRELDVKLTIKMKAVSEALAQEDANAAPDGAAAAAAKPAYGAEGAKPPSEVLLPFGKLQSEKLQKMLYHKLMLTNPDQSARNVRVRARPGIGELEKYAQRKLMTQGLDDGDIEDDVSEFASHAAAPAQPENAEATAPMQSLKEDETREPVVDRDTVKRLSNLIITREKPARRGKRSGDTGSQ
ncbi:hypothetical protein M885DRAFT_509383 [Pelagophyceae sp. CCMP2097]|nr:hypothetical protein M885DRAFT_509383 [Pelagophyceae sp. CCMP2097]